MHRRPQRTHIDLSTELGAPPRPAAPLRATAAASGETRAAHLYQLHAERKHVRQLLRGPVDPTDTSALEQLDDAVGA